MTGDRRNRAHAARLFTVGAVVLAVTAAALPAQAAADRSARSVSTADSAPLAGTAADIAARRLAVPSDLRLVRTRRSLLATHEWYRQVEDGREVVGGWYARHVSLADGSTTVWDGRRAVGTLASAEPAVSAETAERTAARANDATFRQTGDADLMVLPATSRTRRARLVWSVHTATGEGAVTSYVDAVTGEPLLSVESATKKRALVTGRGRVFAPSPPVKRQDATLRDHKDSNTAVPRSAYTRVDLPRLRPRHTLTGRWVRIVNDDRATSQTDAYFYGRANDKFEQVSAYYAVDAAQNYLHRLHFRDVNAHAQQVLVDAFPDDNSYFDASTDLIAMGSGGVDDAEDLEVVWHEYGHAVQADQVPDFGWRAHTGAIGEGFGDYLAVTMSQPRSPDTSVTPWACVMDWDATSYDHRAPSCLRRVDRHLQYPRDLTGEVHHDGQIWSRALWDLNRSVGRNRATTIAVEAQFWMNPRIRMPAAARLTVNAARSLYGDEVATATRAVFVARGILG